MKTINNVEYKTLKEILTTINTNLRYPKVSEQLHSLALTEFAIEAEKNGATILSASVKKIKTDSGDIKNVIGSYIKYTYNFTHQYYIQFDSNPFFEPMGYIEYYTNKHRISTGLTELPHIWDNVNPYSIEDSNIMQLIENLRQAEKYLKSLSFNCKDQYVSYRDNYQQKIYQF